MCKCTNTMMRESMVDFAVFFCAEAPDFHDLLLIPFIQQLPIASSDMEILEEMFDSFKNETEFKRIFLDFCDDVSYLLIAKDVQTDVKLDIQEDVKKLVNADIS